MTTASVCLKGRQAEFGPRLQWARDVVYVGRRCTMGGWDLPKSPWANPFRAQRVGGAVKAVELYFAYLRSHPELVTRARRELAGKRLACFCATEDPRLCHAACLAALCDLPAGDLARLLGGAIGAAL